MTNTTTGTKGLTERDLLIAASKGELTSEHVPALTWSSRSYCAETRSAADGLVSRCLLRRLFSGSAMRYVITEAGLSALRAEVSR